jgi:hypothetical protein
MTTFNLQDSVGNYYFGYEPGNRDMVWTDDVWKALILTIDQARELMKLWPGRGFQIVISVESDAIDDAQFQQELFCAKGEGRWCDYVNQEELVT